MNLAPLQEQMLLCEACDLCKTRTKVVFGEGSTAPLLMIVGEAPGKDEDEAGTPFLGPAGAKLDKILAFVGVERQDVYITNAVLCRPPNGRHPRPEEIEACKWRLDLQIQALRPQLVVALGKVATQSLNGKPVKGALSQYFFDSKVVREKYTDGWIKYQCGGHVAKVLISYHPSYLLRSPIKGYRTVLPHWKKVKAFVEQA